MMKKANSSTKSSGGFLGNYFIKLWLVLVLDWNTFVDVLKLLATMSMFLKDTETPLKTGLGGSGATPRRFVHRMVSLDDVKIVKNARPSDREGPYSGPSDRDGAYSGANDTEGSDQEGGSRSPVRHQPFIEEGLPDEHHGRIPWGAPTASGR
ncbi:hypothetical protein LWI28_010127 [Acer negundo]|uniref:Uncharacterized protein n=1 Tax=Acer negundo TaxID=4023 RepID=A0AAD5JJ00_ACENE|nr:hypothetical protein LWI28_010127 [Acer negundo]